MKRVLLTLLFLVLPVLLVVWQVCFADTTSWYLVAAVLLLFSALPFFLHLERKPISAREMALLSVLTALAVVSRAVFYLIPQVKPIAAVVIVAGMCLGPFSGYMVGALSAFLSNFLFGQGIWTPFQMVALGLVGCTRPRRIRSAVDRRPSRRSPSRCTMGPPPSMLAREAMYLPYSMGSWKGWVNCFDTRMAKFVFPLLLWA